MLVSRGIRSNLVSFELIFEALQLELFRFMYHKLSSEMSKIPEFNLLISLKIIVLFFRVPLIAKTRRGPVVPQFDIPVDYYSEPL